MTAETSMKGRLATPEAVRRYALAGKAIFTLRSMLTGTRFTYRVCKAEEVTDITVPAWKRIPTWFVFVLTGESNENDYSYMAALCGEALPLALKFGAKSRVGINAPSAIAFQFFIDRVLNQGKLSPNLEIWHEGRCGRCGRKLTVPESIAAGLGPDCAEMGF